MKTFQPFDMLAKTMHGLENVLADEIAQIGGTITQIHKRAVSFTGDKRVLYKANLHLRTALRILMPIRQFTVRTEDRLYRQMKKIPWDQYLDVQQTFAIDCVLNTHHFNHTKYVALKTKDAIADWFRAEHGQRPFVSVHHPDIRFHIFIQGDQCTVYLDSSGDSLHKRAYRLEKNKAPLNEIVAAGMILLSGWDKKTCFLDPMCGSGTLLIEAALIAANIPPALKRSNH